MGVKMKIVGFEEALKALERAGKDIDKEAAKAVKESAKVMEQELKASAQNAHVPEELIADIGSETRYEAGVYIARVGWKLGSYDPKNPSNGYKAMFLNYGTKLRTTKKGSSRGQLIKKNFIDKAKRKANKRIGIIQDNILQKVQEDLK